MLRHPEENRTAATSEEKKTFVRKCPVTDCRGFLSSRWKCDLCKNYVCPDCNEIKNGDDHVCDPNAVETINLLKKDTKPCVKCGTMIFKISGCSQMWCDAAEPLNVVSSTLTSSFVAGAPTVTRHSIGTLGRWQRGCEVLVLATKRAVCVTHFDRRSSTTRTFTTFSVNTGSSRGAKFVASNKRPPVARNGTLLKVAPAGTQPTCNVEGCQIIISSPKVSVIARAGHW